MGQSERITISNRLTGKGLYYMKGFTLFFLAIFIFFQGFAQSISLRGMIREGDEKKGLASATVTLADSTGKRSRSVVSTNSGSFELLDIQRGFYKLSVTSVGYSRFDTLIQVTRNTNLRPITLFQNSSELDEVIVRATPPGVKQKVDTLEYSASSYKVNPDADAQDMVRKMPGITIEDGVVKAGGEDIKKVTIDGREFFGDDANAALKNLPAEVIDKVQVYDRQSDQAQFTGVDDGNAVKALNIVTKQNMRNGQYGRVYAGYGTDNHYSAGGNMTFLKENQRISIVGMTNNINQQNFAEEDLLGVTAQGGRGNGRFGNSGNFMTWQAAGINKTNALGINYSDKPNKKLTITGSYFFNNRNSETENLIDRQLFTSGDSSRFYNQVSTSNTENSNHRANMRIEYDIDSMNSIIFTPSFSIQKNQSVSVVTGGNFFPKGIMTSQTENITRRSSDGYNLNAGLLFRHRFAKPRRNFSIGLNTGYNERTNENYLDALTSSSNETDSIMQFTDQANAGFRISSNISYVEPIGKKGQLQFNYNPSRTTNSSDKQTFRMNDLTGKYSDRDDSLSTVFDNIYTTQRAGINYRIGDREQNFSVGLAYQRSDLHTTYDFPEKFEINRSFSNFLPEMNFHSKLSAKSTLRVNYRTSVDAPDVWQLQQVINNNNPLFLSTGNADLEQTFSQRIWARYNFTQSSNGLSFFANLSFQKTNDYIGNASYIAAQDSMLTPTIVLYKGSQLTKPVNLDGYWNTRSFFSFGMPLRFIKSTINFNGGHSYSKTPGMINQIANFSRNNSFRLGATLASNISEYIDFNLNYSANISKVRNSLQPRLNNDYLTQSAGFSSNLLTKNGWVLQNDLSYQSYHGLTDDFKQEYFLWNMGVAKKFLKGQKGELKLTVFDLLKQNKSIGRNVTETYIEDFQTKVLQQYFMLTFSYKLRNFGKGKVQQSQGDDGPGGNRSFQRGQRPGNFD